MLDSSKTACGETVGYLHMETEDGVTTDKKLFEGEEEIDDRGDTICRDCKADLPQ
jgi:hypothetical protein